MFPQNLHTKKHQAFRVNESLILQRVSEGDWEAYTDLFNYYLPKLSQYIFPFAGQSKQDTEEVIQEVFLKIWEKKETLITINSFDSYLFRMAKNKLLDLLDKRKSTRTLHVKYSSLRDQTQNEPEEKLQFAQYHATAKEAIDQLSIKLKTVFVMSYEQELSLDEIADSLSIPKETVKKRLYLANTFIKDFLRRNADWLIFLIFGFFC